MNISISRLMEMRFPFVEQNIDEQSELRLEADNSERRLIELDFLFKGACGA